MKKIYLTCLAILAIQSGIQAQLILTKAANEPIAGDSWTTKKFDSTTVVSKNTGTGQTWNFNNLTATSFTEVVTYTNSSSTAGYSFFPTSTLAEIKGGSETGYYNTSGANFEFQGFYDSNGPTTLNLSNTAIMAAWPISYGSVNADPLSGTMTSGTMSINWNGTITTNAAGSGTVILPGGNTFSNCLMVVSNISISIGATDTYSEKRYSFYHSSNKFPIAEFKYETSTSGTTTSTYFAFNATQSALTTGVNDLSNKTEHLLIYPNPAKDWISIETGVDHMLSVEICDVTGKVLLKENVTRGVDISGLLTGLYLLNIETDSGKMTKRLIVKD